MFCIKDVRINLFSDTNDNKNSSLSEYSLSVFVYSGLRNILHQQPRDLSSAVVRRPVSSSQSDGGGGGSSLLHATNDCAWCELPHRDLCFQFKSIIVLNIQAQFSGIKLKSAKTHICENPQLSQ